MGIAVLDNGKRKQTLLKAAELIFLSFSDRYLPFDCVKAAHYAQIIAFAKKGRPISVKDAQISAIAVQYSTLLRNEDLIIPESMAQYFGCIVMSEKQAHSRLCHCFYGMTVRSKNQSGLGIIDSSFLTTQNTTDSNVVGHLSLVNPWLS